MISPRFDHFFDSVTGYEPFDYQRRLAGGDPGTPCVSHLIDIPTGLGKTAAVVLAWLWNRIELGRVDWPRRLVYCLPMRTLVEQTEDNARLWLDRPGCALAVGLHVLMGGEEAEEWDLRPEQPAILIGTQDMLLSRALNRGYGMSRYRWPLHFGLLNNDCLWVLDETQLMGPGLATASQLEAFRLPRGEGSVARFNSYPAGRSVTWYASATADQSHLETRDWRGQDRPEDFLFGLLREEKSSRTGIVAERRLSTKRLDLQPGWNFGDGKKAPDPSRIAAILTRHKKMTDSLRDAPVGLPRRTLVICNTVDRAVAVHDALKDLIDANAGIELILMHSRFRPKERAQQYKRLGSADGEAPHGGQIVIATQVVEAGVDLSSAILWTEVAPLASLVQRFGRLNRSAEFGHDGTTLHGFGPEAVVVGIEVQVPGPKTKKADKDAAERAARGRYRPYAIESCAAAWNGLGRLDGDASPAALDAIKDAVNASIDRCPYSLMRHELLDFFDTDANLSLGFTDVSPFVRGIDDDTDIYVLWRDWESSGPDGRPFLSPDYQRQELCPVSIGKANGARFLLSKGWVWRGKDSGWASVQNLDPAPGMTILLPSSAGGYREDSGWTGRDEDKPVASVYEPRDTPSDEEMLSSLENGWQSIAQHTEYVTQDWESIVGALGHAIDLSSAERLATLAATHWHDIGKNHRDWQSAAIDALERACVSIPDGCMPIAKFSLSDSPQLSEKNSDGAPRFTGYGLKKKIRALRQSFRPGLCHEVASALAFRQSELIAYGKNRPFESLLAEYLIMSHHGRVRKVLRDETPRLPDNAKDSETVRGVSNGDTIEPVKIGGAELGCDSISIDCRRMGRDEGGNESYTRGVLRLLDWYGPFRLAFLEAVFRAADIRASIRAEKSAGSPGK